MHHLQNAPKKEQPSRVLLLGLDDHTEITTQHLVNASEILTSYCWLYYSYKSSFKHDSMPVEEGEWQEELIGLRVRTDVLEID